MKKLILFPILALLIMALISCEKDQVEPITSLDSQEEMATTRANATVPFKASYDTHPYLNNGVDFLCDPGDAPSEDAGLFTIPGEGNATHLGNSTWSSESWVFSFGMPDEDGAYPASQTGCQFFTAADGSTLIGEYCGCVTFYGPDPRGAEGYGQYIITDGTGRFERATGKGEYSYYVESEFDANGTFLAHLDFNGILNKKGSTDYPLYCPEECLLDGE